MKADTKKDAQLRMKRIAGQIGGIQRMIDDERYCVDILLQIAAARAALTKVGKTLLAGHVETCVVDAVAKGGKARREKLDELLDVFDRYGGG